ncbi:hypothetical protein [Neisseria musculi]|uniref:Phage Tail Collar Domain protein n=1 Tax=Neisseria musculi TaxID=1815583 RepID=A0A7H1MB04_9NEIS|nr:hypothetical protein [Neisseria musculi]QNT58819.1 putative phage Tail Collar Domain protein [Neisseria musculi]
MANLTETARWEAGIYQLETSDPVMGGPNGIDNRPARELANRTLWLKNELAKAVQSIGSNKTAADAALALKADKARRLSAGAGLTGGGDLGADRTIALAVPSTPTLAGVAKLVNALDSSAADAALTAAMGKKLQDEKVSKTGSETVNGAKTFTDILTAGRAEHWGKYRMPVQSCAHWILETDPASNIENEASLRFNIKYEQGGQARYIHFPAPQGGNKNVAYQDWVNSRFEGNRFRRPVVKGGATDVTLDLGNRASITAELGGDYIGHGHMQLVLHNTSGNHNISGLPLPAKSPVQLNFYIMGGYSFIDCHYLFPTANSVPESTGTTKAGSLTGSNTSRKTTA